MNVFRGETVDHVRIIPIRAINFLSPLSVTAGQHFV